MGVVGRDRRRVDGFGRGDGVESAAGHRRAGFAGSHLLLANAVGLPRVLGEAVVEVVRYIRA